jgi:hypothetical protein
MTNNFKIGDVVRFRIHNSKNPYEVGIIEGTPEGCAWIKYDTLHYCRLFEDIELASPSETILYLFEH